MDRGGGGAFDVVIVDPLGDALDGARAGGQGGRLPEVLPPADRAAAHAGAAVVILENVGHAEEAQHRPTGRAAKMHKADLLFSCNGGRGSARAAGHGDEGAGDARGAAQGRHVAVRGVDAGDRAAGAAGADRAAPAERPRGPRTARLGAIADALGDEPMSVREVAKSAGKVNGETIAKSTAYDDARGPGDRRQGEANGRRLGGCPSVRVLKDRTLGHLCGSPRAPAQLFESNGEPPVCEGCGGLLVERRRALGLHGPRLRGGREMNTPEDRPAIVAVPVLMTVASVAELLDCSPRTVRRRIDAGELPAVTEHGRSDGPRRRPAGLRRRPGGGRRGAHFA